MKNFVHPGEYVPVVAPYAVVSGNGVLVGSLFGIASVNGALGETIELATGGVFDVNKVAAQAWTAGQRVFWDNTNRVFTTVATSNTLVGVATQDAANPSSSGRVRLNGSF